MIFMNPSILFMDIRLLFKKNTYHDSIFCCFFIFVLLCFTAAKQLLHDQHCPVLLISLIDNPKIETIVL